MVMVKTNLKYPMCLQHTPAAQNMDKAVVLSVAQEVKTKLL